MHDNFSGAGRREVGGRGWKRGWGGKAPQQIHAPRKFHAICYVLCASSADGGECYAGESQNDRLQFIQFILLSQTFVSASVHVCVTLSVCACVYLLCRFINKLMKQFPQHLIWAIFCSVQSLSVQRKAAGKESEIEGKKEEGGEVRATYGVGVHEFVPLWHVKFSFLVHT